MILRDVITRNWFTNSFKGTHQINSHFVGVRCFFFLNLRRCYKKTFVSFFQFSGNVLALKKQFLFIDKFEFTGVRWIETGIEGVIFQRDHVNRTTIGISGIVILQNHFIAIFRPFVFQSSAHTCYLWSRLIICYFFQSVLTLWLSNTIHDLGAVNAIWKLFCVTALHVFTHLYKQQIQLNNSGRTFWIM